MQSPKISIVTPSFNQAQFLERTILSVINQNYPNLEYIIIDGGSTDGSVDIVKKYDSKLSYWVSEKDNGQSDALNKGFEKCTGEILAFLNSDDMFLNGILEKVGAVFSNFPEVDFVYGHNFVINEFDDILKLSVALPYKLKENLNGVFSIPQQSAFWKKWIYNKVGGFNINNHSCMDGEFFALAGTLNPNYHLIDEPLSAFRLHLNSKTMDKKKYSKEIYNKDQYRFIEKIKNNSGISINAALKYYYMLKYYPYKFYKRLIYKDRLSAKVNI